MRELRGMRAVVQFLRQSAEPCAAPPTSPFTALLMDRLCKHRRASSAVRLSVAALHLRPRILLTQDLANQIADLSRFPQLKPLFQLGVPVDALGDFSKEQATPEATEHCAGLVSAHDTEEARLGTTSRTGQFGLAASSLRPDARAVVFPRRCPT